MIGIYKIVKKENGKTYYDSSNKAELEKAFASRFDEDASTEGDDTVEKHPYIFKDSDLIIINKIDLADAVGASTDKMVADAKKLNPICYDSSAHLYWTLGEAVGRAFCDGKEICEVKENDTQ